jgi:hypothetical protein
MEHRFGLTRQLCRCAFEYLARRPAGGCTEEPLLSYSAFEARLLQTGAVLAQHAGRTFVDCTDVAVAMRLHWRVEMASLLLDPVVRAEWRKYLQMRTQAAATTLQRREEAYRAQCAAEASASLHSLLPRSTFMIRPPTMTSNPDETPAEQHAKRMSRLILTGGDALYTGAMQKAFRGLSRMSGATTRPFQPRNKVVKDCLARCQPTAPTVSPTAASANLTGGGGGVDATTNSAPLQGVMQSRKPILSDFEQSQLWHEVWQHPSDEATEGCADLWNQQEPVPHAQPEAQQLPSVEEVAPPGTKKRGRKKATPAAEAPPAPLSTAHASVGVSGDEFQPRVMHLQGDIQLLRPVFVHQHLPRQAYSAHGAARSRQQRRREQRQLQRMRERQARLAAVASAAANASDAALANESAIRVLEDDPVDHVGAGESSAANTGSRVRMNESALALRALASLLIVTSSKGSATKATTSASEAHVRWPGFFSNDEWFHTDADFPSAWQQQQEELQLRGRSKPTEAGRKAVFRTPGRTPVRPPAQQHQARGRSKTPKRAAAAAPSIEASGHRRTTRSKSRTNEEDDADATAMVDVAAAAAAPRSPKHPRPLRRVVLPAATATATSTTAAAASTRITRARATTVSPPPPTAALLPNSARAKRRDAMSPEPASTTVPFPVLDVPASVAPAAPAAASAAVPPPKRHLPLQLASVKHRRQLRLFD